MNIEQARRLQENPDYKAFIEVLKNDAESIKEDMLREDVGNLEKMKQTALTIRQVQCRLENLIEDLQDDEPSLLANRTAYSPAKRRRKW